MKGEPTSNKKVTMKKTKQKNNQPWELTLEPLRSASGIIWEASSSPTGEPKSSSFSTELHNSLITSKTKT